MGFRVVASVGVLFGLLAISLASLEAGSSDPAARSLIAQQPRPAAPQKPAPQAPAARFQTHVDLVTVDVSVLDRDRQPVRGLTAADFTIFEDGQPQRVATFTAIDVPDVVVEQSTPAAWVRTVTPDVARNDNLANDRRIVVIVMDDATPMRSEETLRAKQLARGVIDKLTAGDLAAVIFTMGKSSGQELTADHARLRAAVDKFTGSVLIDNTADVPVASSRGGSGSNTLRTRTDFDEFDVRAMGLYQATLGTLRSVSQALIDLPQRRKALVFVSPGLPIDTGDGTPRQDFGNGADPGVTRRLLLDLEAIFAAAERANVNVYGLDPGGLRAPSATPPRPGPGGLLTGLTAEPGKLNRHFLTTLSENTGGFVIVDTNDVQPGITQIFRENSSYYLVGYPSANQRAEGKFRRIEVRVNRPGVTVRARNGYTEPSAGKDIKLAPAPGAAALASLVQKSDVAMQVSAAPFARPGKRDAALAIVLALREPAPPGASTAAANADVPPYVENLDVQVNAYDANGDRRGADRVNVHLTLRARPGEEVGFEVLSQLDLKPGRYQLRVAADSAALHKSGSVHYDVDVPDFAKADLSLSGLVLSAALGGTTVSKERLASLIPVVPTTAREFARAETVTAFLRVYQGDAALLTPVVLAARIVDERGGTVFESADTLGVDRFSVGRTADYRLNLPLTRLAPGPHLLTITATAGKLTAARDVRFTVR
jgi:VWFA-related protein